LYVHYQKELENFRRNIAMLKEKQNGNGHPVAVVKPLKNAHVRLISPSETFTMEVEKPVYSDHQATLEAVCTELSGLKSLYLQTAKLTAGSTTIEFETDAPVKLLVGFFRDDQTRYAKAPTLETDAGANQYGQADPVLLNAVRIKGLPMVNVHAYHFEKGKHKLILPRGMLLVPGFSSDEPEVRDAGLAGTGSEEAMDWLFY
jgi:hypothetical protein